MAGIVAGGTATTNGIASGTIAGVGALAGAGAVVAANAGYKRDLSSLQRHVLVLRKRALILESLGRRMSEAEAETDALNHGLELEGRDPDAWNDDLELEERDPGASFEDDWEW